MCMSCDFYASLKVDKVRSIAMLLEVSWDALKYHESRIIVRGILLYLNDTDETL